MSQPLVVLVAFGPFLVNDVIADDAHIAAILASPDNGKVAPQNLTVAAGPILPAQPNSVVAVVGAPVRALALTYGFALDLTSTPNTLYQWSGTAWAVALQAGSGGQALTAPGAIAAAPTVTATTASSIAIAWAAPSTGGVPADYLVQYKLTVASSWTTIDAGTTALAATIAGLAATTSYDFRVQATNSAGQGTVSPTLTASTAAASAQSGGSGTLDFSDPNNSALSGAL